MYGSAEDLKSAQDLNYLPGRVSKSAAWGMLARVYMFRAGEPKRDKEVGLATTRLVPRLQNISKSKLL